MSHKDCETFWREVDKITLVCKLKCEKPKLGHVKIIKEIKRQDKIWVPASKARFYLENYFWDKKEQALYRLSIKADVAHRRCVTKDELEQ